MENEINMNEKIIPQIEKKDVILSYPFESMRPFIVMLEEAAKDPTVVSIKMTLYRVADRSKIVDTLIEAAENGKEVMLFVARNVMQSLKALSLLAKMFKSMSSAKRRESLFLLR